MTFKDMIPWRRDRHDVPVRRPEPAEDRLPSPWMRGADDFFERFFQGFGELPFFGGTAGPTPKIDVVERGDELRITAELPGVDEKDVEISLSDDVLTIRGTKRTETESEEAGVYRMERSYGRFERSIPLPDEIDAERVVATFRRGVLEIELPRSERTKERRRSIPITTD